MNSNYLIIGIRIIQDIIHDEEYLKEIIIYQQIWNKLKSQFEVGDSPP
ncbi:hypothetical protein AAA799E16_00732 [Marine Group I thaumarchaeote SCGC AAA799-E16]|uniref:Uncharacterized protein n=3 Tax=Marine Group I TaxID=905826 RepID=A0A087S9A9_9ARCH|nr:hypothetical protein AAA799E16_00732 [Marine Group I thaumarchaeote SCGC AAA799-E16]KFM18426.1 hypothetical protein SCCGRSA3_01112 [Marine Group I thaumarchaeote SCGC RSA3]KFM22313.1 hypothetical protein AAA799B03_00063 [Marine Group I thaumarchaeote SCGC AAA799-B03]